MVDQLLLLARFDNQKQRLQIETVYLNALILDTLTLYSEKIKSKKISVVSQFTTDYDIDSDNYLVAIIIGNIINNAIKYSAEDTVIIIDLNKDEKGTHCIITDQGIGIAKSDLDKVFNPFYRSNATNHPHIKGSGLGLSIVKRIAELLPMDIEIFSETGKGTKVVLSFH
ncbi:MAG: sensor histidine kinase [Flavobacterium sp.]|nr:MAG: sensor histidine kinase [Flavobacterium sp.]